MGKMMEHILKPAAGHGGDRHMSDEDLACLADGRASAEKRREVLSHLSNCGRCYEIFKETLKDVSIDTSPESQRVKRFSSYQYGIAASIIFVLIVAGGLFYKMQTPQMLTASVVLDEQLKTLILESDEKAWSKEHALRLASLLEDRGIKEIKIRKVVMVAAYQPSKDFFAPKEILKIRIENGVAYLEVVEEQEQ